MGIIQNSETFVNEQGEEGALSIDGSNYGYNKIVRVNKAEFEKIGIPMPRYEQPAGIPHYYSEFINGCQYSISASGYPDYSIAIGIEFHKWNCGTQ